MSLQPAKPGGGRHIARSIHKDSVENGKKEKEALQKQIGAILDYHDWANNRIRKETRLLSPEEMEQELGGSFSTYKKTLQHIIVVEMLFFDRWQGAAAGVPVHIETVAQIEAAWTNLEKERRIFLSKLGTDQLDRELRYVDTRGRDVCVSLWQAIFQCVNHSTFHRGQLIEKLRKLSRTPPATDYILYCRDMASRVI